jgi:hypothetical protein
MNAMDRARHFEGHRIAMQRDRGNRQLGAGDGHLSGSGGDSYRTLSLFSPGVVECASIDKIVPNHLEACRSLSRLSGQPSVMKLSTAPGPAQ